MVWSAFEPGTEARSGVVNVQDRRPAISRGGALLVDGVSPSPSPTALLSLLEISPAVLDDTPLPGDALPVLDAGLEMAAHLNALRAAGGLAPLRWDDTLARAALGHCAYIDWQQRSDGSFHAHSQRPGSPFFTGERAGDRHRGWEVIHRDRDGAPHTGVDTWLATPFHRVGPMHPRARSVGWKTSCSRITSCALSVA